MVFRNLSSWQSLFREAEESKKKTVVAPFSTASLNQTTPDNRVDLARLLYHFSDYIHHLADHQHAIEDYPIPQSDRVYAIRLEARQASSAVFRVLAVDDLTKHVIIGNRKYKLLYGDFVDRVWARYVRGIVRRTSAGEDMDVLGGLAFAIVLRDSMRIELPLSVV